MADQTEVKSKENLFEVIEEEAKNLLDLILPVDVSVSSNEERFFLEIKPKKSEDSSLLIGKFGANLNSLQMILPQIVFKKTGVWSLLTLEVEGYRKEREERLIRRAREAADKARFLLKKVEMEPMPPFERRIIHLALQEEKGVKTESQGEGKERRVVVVPVNG